MLTEEMYKDLMNLKKEHAIALRALEMASEKYVQERAENFKGTIDTNKVIETFLNLAHAEYAKKHS